MTDDLFQAGKDLVLWKDQPYTWQNEKNRKEAYAHLEAAEIALGLGTTELKDQARLQAKESLRFLLLDFLSGRKLNVAFSQTNGHYPLNTAKVFIPIWAFEILDLFQDCPWILGYSKFSHDQARVSENKGVTILTVQFTDENCHISKKD